jgi:hypothetical protein
MDSLAARNMDTLLVFGEFFGVGHDQENPLAWHSLRTDFCPTDQHHRTIATQSHGELWRSMRIFTGEVWKIFVRSEIPTHVLTAYLVQKCITLPFLGSSGTSHLLLFGHVLAHAMASSVLRSQADLFANSFSRLGVTVLQAKWPGRPPSVPVQVPFSKIQR